MAFWVVKILTTGMGEAASDTLVRLGGTVAVISTALALVASFTAFGLGTALGDLTADVWGLGNFDSGVMFTIAIMLTAMTTRWLGLNAVAGFWIAYILTRPLGASFADWMSYDGPHLGTLVTTGLWAGGVTVGVAYFLLTHDRSELGTREPIGDRSGGN